MNFVMSFTLNCSLSWYFNFKLQGNKNMNLNLNLKLNLNFILKFKLNLNWGSAQYSTSEKFQICIDIIIFYIL